ncbi:guanine nucleotide exchange factor [Lineolata rhizophorae]|uniref:Guanine nucleotide exchange factor n=1 Tax=Lineolata rhizophorae TaxID=578093 RepID=A0A6A6NQM6_9PEZI|nr:guanine nucleotide exchange factor [Lineolata rhizophorae]
MASATGAAAVGKRKLDEVADLLGKLRVDWNEKILLPQQRLAALETLKVHGRSPENADAIFTKEGIETLSKYGLDQVSWATSREALRVLANAFLLRPPTRQMFVDMGYGPKAAERLKNDSRDDEFLCSRILLLMTYDTDLDFNKLVRENQLADSMNQNILRHSKRFSKNSHKKGPQSTPQEEMAMSETLKLLFNMTHFYPELVPEFSKSIPNILKMLVRIKRRSPPLQPPVNWLVNALVNLELADEKSGTFSCGPMFPKFDQKCNVDYLINLLDKAIVAYKDADLEEKVAPPLTLLRRVFEIAPDGVRKWMQWLLLPTDDERSRPLGQSDTLSARLLRLSTSATDPDLRSNVSAFFFELSGKDATRFVRNVGYGFAAGFLLSQNIAIPENASEAWSTSGKMSSDDDGGSGGGDGAGGAGERSSKESVPVNPVTGQRLDAEEPDRGPPMTKEEKEREAEKLFVLFERLKATGVVDVENPVRTAMQEGRIQELPDSDDEESK